jgi:glycosyltransferase involved in cell wall biosynthesis
MKPSLTVGIIAKNEERDLPKALESIKGIADRIIVVDTGSTDQTVKVATDYGAIVKLYLDASEQDASGDWKLQHFAKARNKAIAIAEELGGTWYCWMDADDVLHTPAALRRALYRDDFDVFGCWIRSSGYEWIHHRLVRLDKHPRFKGRCHEYMVLDGMRQGHLQDVLFIHDVEPGTNQENSNARNLRMLTKEWEEEPSARTAFYLANTHKDAGRHAESIEWYAKRMELGDGFLDEYLFAVLYKARAERAMKHPEEALKTIAIGREHCDWAEFVMLEAQIAYDAGRYADAIVLGTLVLDRPISPTVLWREPQMYKDQPARLISWCHEHLGNINTAIVWAQLAAERIGGPDLQWQARIERLRGLASPKPRVAKQKVIALNRPGAIGDILMTLNLIPALRDANPDWPIWYFCDARLGAPEELGNTMLKAGIDQILDYRSWEQWANTVERPVPLVGYPLQAGYPEKPMRDHLLQYFAKEVGLTVNGSLQALTLPKPANPLGDGEPYATIQMSAGWSKYKEWFPERWELVRRELADIRMIQIDKDQGYMLDQSIAIFANARMHIGIDSFCNHLTNYYWQDDVGSARRVPGVILWGSTQASAAGYAHNVNISKGIACQPCFRENPAISLQPRGPCINPPRASYDDNTAWACMASISVDEVVIAIRDLWGRAQ